MKKSTPNNAYDQMFKDYPEILDVDHMSAMLGVSTKTGYKIINDGKIHCIKVGRAYRIPKINVIKYLRISLHT